nr:immunoglobulin heavy chain junction region [Macaca mulatta]MOX63608.1 immunoglobulin heavy chain junction region [Macaca mulatta]MOX63715.1 immunoglobulin heavy chain junction region [Macaca mulatta]MOX66308.1 immunoglobulin heavy chain junction region [Macaca mulatta]
CSRADIAAAASFDLW